MKKFIKLSINYIKEIEQINSIHYKEIYSFESFAQNLGDWLNLYMEVSPYNLDKWVDYENKEQRI